MTTDRQPLRSFLFAPGNHLWQDDAVEPGPDDRHEVGIAEIGIGGVDANIEPAATRPPQSRGHRLARRRLLGDSNGVFEIEMAASASIGRTAAQGTSRRFGAGKGSRHPLGRGDLRIGRGKHPVHNRDLVRMDAHLP